MVQHAAPARAVIARTHMRAALGIYTEPSTASVTPKKKNKAGRHRPAGT
jgi:hypothetical protein